MRWIVLAPGLTSPGALSVLDCVNRRPDELTGGASDRKGWLTWLVPALPVSAVGVGYGIVVGCYYGAIRRNSPVRR